jgi:hypothetical protein
VGHHVGGVVEWGLPAGDGVLEDGGGGHFVIDVHIDWKVIYVEGGSVELGGDIVQGPGGCNIEL